MFVYELYHDFEKHEEPGRIGVFVSPEVARLVAGEFAEDPVNQWPDETALRCFAVKVQETADEKESRELSFEVIVPARAEESEPTSVPTAERPAPLPK